MDEFVRLKYSFDNLGTINRVRTAYRVLYLSDITNLEGTKIEEAYREGHQKKSQRQSKYSWPTKQVSFNDCLVWTDTMQRVSLPQFFLPYTPSAWKTMSHLIYKCVFVPTTTKVVHRVNEVWHLFH